MKVSELARELGEKPKAVLDMINRGGLKAEKVANDNPNSLTKQQWEILTPLEEARAVMAARVRRSSRKSKGSIAPAELPAKRDLFKPKEAARMAGINESTMYKWIKDNKVQVLRNGRFAYIPRTVVERMRETFIKPVVKPVSGQTVVAVSKPDPRIDRLEKELAAVYGFLTRFAASCGYKE